MGTPSKPGARPAGLGRALGAEGCPAGAAPSGTVAEPRDALMVEALYPAAHGRGVVVEELGDGGSRVALEGPQGHDQAKGEAEGAVEEGQEPG